TTSHFMNEIAEEKNPEYEWTILYRNFLKYVIKSEKVVVICLSSSLILLIDDKTAEDSLEDWIKA
ncbi:18145_t:CDS:1, partial [Gigaspora rosea]